MIAFNGFPFLDSKEEHTFHVPVSTPMTPVSSITSLPASGMTLAALSSILDKTSYSGFPIVSDPTSRLLIGYIGRTELQYALAKAKTDRMLSPDATCVFSPDSSPPRPHDSASHPPPPQPPHRPSSSTAPQATASSSSSAHQPSQPAMTFDAMSTTRALDFSRFVDPTPLTVHPRLPLETALQLFQKMGPRVVLVEHKGRLAGLITVKDCLKYQWRAEARERGEEQHHDRTAGGGAAGGVTKAERWERWLWGKIEGVGLAVAGVARRWSGGRIRLGERVREGEGWSAERRGLLVGDSVDPRDARGGILDGTEDVDEEGEGGQEVAEESTAGVELQERS